jgi:hypothetical protein
VRKLAGFLALWCLCVALAWFYFLRRTPQSSLEWLLLLFAGLPAFLLASFVGEALGLLFGKLPGVRHLHGFAERKTVGKGVSSLRVFVYLCTSLLALAGVVAVTWLWRQA